MADIKDFAVVAQPNNQYFACNITGLTDEQVGDMLTTRFGSEVFMRAQAETVEAAIESAKHAGCIQAPANN